MKKHYNLFCKQISELIDDYPNLEVKQDNGKKYLKGILDIPNDSGQISGNFLVEIHYSPLFPYRFPILFEIGGDIENTADWHKYPNGQCCITATPDEISKSKHGISIRDFIRNYCISFFANHIHRLLTGNYKNGEYLHGIDGLKQFYTELFNTNNLDVMLSYINYVFLKKEFNTKRNDSCFCNSQIKFKYCHLNIFKEMIEIGYQQMINDLKLIYT